jgi:hypothetical protein
MPAEPKALEPAPIFLLCHARSGSTLLRRILDAHPEIACPPETNVPSLFRQLAHTSWCLSLDANEADQLGKTCVQAVADMTLGAYMRNRGKTRWADKSLGTADFASQLTSLFPRAKFLCLYRNSTDMVASGIEACRWGFGAYGFAPYVSANPGNFLVAMFQYWADHTSKILNFEKSNQTVCMRIRYEDLVSEPDKTLRIMYEFLEVDWDRDLAAVEEALTAQDSRGPGDYKIAFTDSIHADSINRGGDLPTEIVPQPLLDRIDALHEELNYAPIVRALRLEHLKQSWMVNESSLPARGEIRALFEETVASRLRDANHHSLESSIVAMQVSIVVPDVGLAYTIDPKTRSVTEEDIESLSPDDWLLRISSETVLSISSRGLNPGVALRTGEIALIKPERQGALKDDEPSGFDVEMILKLFRPVRLAV